MSEPKLRPWRMFAPLGLVLVLAAGWSAYWFIAMNEIKKGLARGEAELAAQGMTLDCAERRFGGYPFRFSFECVSPAFAIDRPDRAGSVKASSLQVYVQAWNFRHGIALLEGPTAVEDRNAGLAREFSHGLVRASLKVPSDLEAQAVIDIPGLAADGLGKAAKLVLSGRLVDGKTAEVAISGTGVELIQPTGAAIALDAVGGTAQAPLALAAAPDPLRQASMSGETVTISSLVLKQGALTLQSDGTLGVDAAGFPAGTVNTKVSDLNELFAAIEKTGALSPKDAKTAREMAGLLNGGKEKDAAVSIVAKDGGLYWGFVKLADLKPLF